MRYLLFYITILFLVLSGCNTGKQTKPKEIIIFHAGSLSVPFKQMTSEYEKRNPGVKFLLEAAGSLVCARKITELKKPCDIIASADYFVINKLIIPDYASWSIRFATNEIVIAFQDKSGYAEEIDSVNWMNILLREDVTFSRSDPDSDPCGYRTVIVFKLAEKYYGMPGLEDKLTFKNREFIRPKEVDLVALIESNAVDYMFQYKSVAIQHNLRYIELPDDINLGNPGNNKIYSSVSLDITGSTPNSKMTVNGEYINYSLAVLKDAPQSEAAIDFIAFMLSDEGMEIFRRNGQKPIIPFSTEQQEMIPVQLRIYLKEQIH
ncbi:MAG: tungstate ABC transporter substrate-binding protein WtpA [Bacteroidales bacterium]|jgi:molybdate/tungstate transport system substrate-binding protein|nr:tungstate ABC transporter substrate-binding protein WtpA [Bacteroidales bacterium]